MARTVTGLRWYYLAATAARTGDEMVAVAVVLLVLDRTGSAPLAGAVVAAYLLPTLASGPLLGAWLDRTRYRRAALAANQVLLAVGMLGLVATTGNAPGWTAPALTALVGVSVPMTSGGFTSLLPRLVPPALLPRAHAVEGVTFNASAIVGPAAAATLAAAVSPTVAVAAIAVAATASLCALAGVPTSAPQAGPAGDPPPLPVLAALRAGLRHLVRTPPLRAVTAGTSLAFVGLGMLTVALPLHTERLGGGAALAGYVWAAVEAGAVVTALAWGRWHARWRPERVVLAALAGTGGLLLGWPAAGAFGVLLALAVAAGLVQGPGMPALFTTRQRCTPGRLYGQISTTGASLKLTGFAGGSALGGLLSPTVGVTTVLVLAGGLHLAAAATGLALARPGPPATGTHPGSGGAAQPDPVPAGRTPDTPGGASPSGHGPSGHGPAGVAGVA